MIVECVRRFQHGVSLFRVSAFTFQSFLWLLEVQPDSPKENRLGIIGAILQADCPHCCPTNSVKWYRAFSLPGTKVLATFRSLALFTCNFGSHNDLICSY